jgi:hypothetical protein
VADGAVLAIADGSRETIDAAAAAGAAAPSPPDALGAVPVLGDIAGNGSGGGLAAGGEVTTGEGDGTRTGASVTGGGGGATCRAGRSVAGST